MDSERRGKAETRKRNERQSAGRQLMPKLSKRRISVVRLKEYKN
jgi:hypothetical protein